MSGRAPGGTRRLSGCSGAEAPRPRGALCEEGWSTMKHEPREMGKQPRRRVGVGLDTVVVICGENDCGFGDVVSAISILNRHRDSEAKKYAA